jgi:hypothetical protein
MGRACSTHWGEEECIQDFGVKARRKETTKNTYTGGKMDLRDTGLGGMDWIDLAQDRDQ